MIKTKISLLTLTAILVLSSLILAGPPENLGVDAAIPTSEELNPEETIAQLQIQYSLWLDAVLSGSESEAKFLEKNLLGIINFNIMVSQEEVRAMAKEVALAPGNQEDLEANVTNADELKQAISHLNDKEALFRSAVKTEAFSNKYRLLGDYIDLLRRELKMPRLKLAANDKTLNNTGSQSGITPAQSE